MASLLSTVAATSAETSRKRKSSPEIPSSEPYDPEPSSEGSYDHRKRYEAEEDEDLWVEKKPRVSEIPMDENFDMDMGGGMDVDEVEVKAEPVDDEDMEIKVRDRASKPLATSTKVNATSSRRRVVNASAVKQVKAEIKAEPDVKPKVNGVANGKPAPGAVHWSSVQESLVAEPKVSELDEVKAPSGGGLVKAENVLDEDGSLKMFWLDFMEQEGVVHLVGKVLDRKSGKYVSACVSVNGIKRNLFVKPRAKKFCECAIQAAGSYSHVAQLATLRPTSRSPRPTCIKSLTRFDAKLV